MKQQIYPAEFFSPGHSDKLCDAIADRLVDEAVQRDGRSLCEIEVVVENANVSVRGTISSAGARDIDRAAIVRDVYASAGYGERYPDPAELDIHEELGLFPQIEVENPPPPVYGQCVVAGYANDLPGTNYLPPEQWIAYRLMRQLMLLREQESDLVLGPAGDVLVLFDAAQNQLAGLCISVQPCYPRNIPALSRAMRGLLPTELELVATDIPGFNPIVPEDFVVNFDAIGPAENRGMSGRRVVADTYGPRVPICGSQLSGTDLFDTYRAGVILARCIAKSVVFCEGVKECLTTLVLVPGETEFRIVSIRDSDAKALNTSRWSKRFDLSVQSVGAAYARSARLAECGLYGHFTEPNRPWEYRDL
jgi:S-adenosylmethionine synthetase